MKPKKQFRDEFIRVRVRPDEKAKFERLAESRHTDISEIIRQLLHKESESALSAQERALGA